MTILIHSHNNNDSRDWCWEIIYTQVGVRGPMLLQSLERETPDKVDGSREYQFSKVQQC